MRSLRCIEDVGPYCRTARMAMLTASPASDTGILRSFRVGVGRPARKDCLDVVGSDFRRSVGFLVLSFAKGGEILLFFARLVGVKPRLLELMAGDCVFE